MEWPRMREAALVLLLLAVECYTGLEYDGLGLHAVQHYDVEPTGQYFQDWRRKDTLYLDEEAEEAERAAQLGIPVQTSKNEHDSSEEESLYLDEGAKAEESQEENVEKTNQYAQDLSEEVSQYVDEEDADDLNEEYLEEDAEQQEEEEIEQDDEDDGLESGEQVVQESEEEPEYYEPADAEDLETYGEDETYQNSNESEKLNQESEELTDAESGEEEYEPDEVEQEQTESTEEELEYVGDGGMYQEGVDEAYLGGEPNGAEYEQLQQTDGDVEEYVETDLDSVEAGQQEMYEEKGGDAETEYMEAEEDEINQELESEEEYGQEYVPILSDETLLGESEEEGLQRVERSEPKGRPPRSEAERKDPEMNEVKDGRRSDSAEKKPLEEGQSDEGGLKSEKGGLRWVAPWRAWPVYPGEERTDSIKEKPLGVRPLGTEQLGMGPVQSGQDEPEQLASVQGGAGQGGTGQVGTGQVGAGQLEAGQADVGQVAIEQVGAGQVGTEQVGAGQVGTGQVGTGQVETGQVGAGQVGTGQVGTGQVGTGDVGTGQVGAGKVETDQVGEGQVGTGHGQAGSSGVGPIGSGRPRAPTPSSIVPGGPGGTPESAPEDVFHPDRTRDFHPFEMRVCAAASERATGNAALSPVGARLVLGVLGEAASGGAAAELRRALGLPDDPKHARRIYRRLIAALKQKRDGYLMNMGSRIYLDEHYEPLPDMAQVYSRIFDTDIQKIDFETPGVARNEINSWVANKTHGHIPMLLTNDQLLKNAITMILNVIYFKGKWLYPFPRNDTIPDLFYKTPNETVKVEFMRQTGDFYYTDSERLDAKILRLPYRGKKYSMFIILPRNPKNFKKLLRSLHPDIVRDEMTKMQKMEIDVKIPKIKMDCTIQLKEILQAIGIIRIFNVSSEINLTQNKKNIRISQIFQKVSLEVNEEGTIASMVTGSGLANTFGGRLEFKATHPYLFFIEEERTGTVLFVSKVIDPTKTESVIDMEENERLKRRSLWSYFPIHKSSRKSSSDSESDSESHSSSDSDSESDENSVFYRRPLPRNGTYRVHFPTYYYANPNQGYPNLRLPERK